MGEQLCVYVKTSPISPEVIQDVVWFYHRFNLSCRDIADVMAERGIVAGLIFLLLMLHS
jgi:hypothetical protein